VETLLLLARMDRVIDGVLIPSFIVTPLPFVELAGTLSLGLIVSQQPVASWQCLLSLVGKLEVAFLQPLAEGRVVTEVLEQLRVVGQEGCQHALHGAVMLDTCVLLV
jgi:hypothetical protein